MQTVNGSLNPTYTYDEYVEAFGEEPPLPPGWEYEKEDKKELAAPAQGHRRKLLSLLPFLYGGQLEAFGDSLLCRYRRV